MVVFEGFTDLDFFLPWDLLNRVRLLNLVNEWTVEILGDSTSVQSAAGLSLTINKPYEYANNCDGILFCSGPKTIELMKDLHFLSKFKLNYSSQTIAAIDSSALILGALNLLKGKHAKLILPLLKNLKTWVQSLLEIHL
jgi:transcriptional regulator GlxA family with amidase domain